MQYVSLDDWVGLAQRFLCCFVVTTPTESNYLKIMEKGSSDCSKRRSTKTNLLDLFPSEVLILIYTSSENCSDRPTEESFNITIHLN